MEPIFEAAKKGQLDEVKRLLTGGFLRSAVYVNTENYGGNANPIEPLIVGYRAVDIAAYYGQINVVKYLLEECNADATYTLEAAACGNAGDVVDYLIVDRKISVDKLSDRFNLKSFDSPLKVAASNGRLEMVKRLVGKHKAHVGSDILSCAFNVGIVRYLVEHCSIPVSKAMVDQAIFNERAWYTVRLTGVTFHGKDTGEYFNVKHRYTEIHSYLLNVYEKQEGVAEARQGATITNTSNQTPQQPLDSSDPPDPQVLKLQAELEAQKKAHVKLEADMQRMKLEVEQAKTKAVSHLTESTDKTTAQKWQHHPFSIISPREITKGEQIGVGTYGTVYKATYRGATVAVKELHFQTTDETIKKNFNHEVQLLANLNHDNIIAYRGMVNEPRSLVMEFAEGGTLFALIHSSLALTEQERFRFAYEISLAIAYLHQCNPEVIHCDLKSQNVLLDKNRKVKVSDFGLSKTKIIASSQSHNGMRGTPTHMAPELLNPDDNSGSKLTPKIDIYSFAIILWELATKQIPFANKNPMQIMFFICSGNRPAELVNANPAYKSLVAHCWAQNPNDRPTAKQVVDILKVQQDETSLLSSSSVPFTSSGFMSMGLGKQ